MQKFGVLAAAALATGTEAYRNRNIASSPFEGDEHTIAGENRTSHRAFPAPSTNKYESLISKVDSKPNKTAETKLYEKIFGESEEATKLSQDIKDKTEQTKYGRGRLGAQRVVISNPSEDVFSANFYMGEKLEMKAIIDNATDLVAVSDRYDITGNVENGTATYNEDDPLSKVSYGTAEMKGKWATDKICLQLGKCVDLDFFLISEESNLPDGIDAIFGWARPDQVMQAAPNQTPDDREFYLSALGATNEKMFSTRFSRGDFVSWIDIGAPDAGMVSSEPIGIDTVPDYFWSMANQGVRIGEKEAGAYTFQDEEGSGSWIGDGIYTIFDTGSSDIYMSILWFDSFVEEFYAAVGIEYEIKEGAAYSKCNANFPNIYFMVDGYWLQIPSDDYLSEDDDLCRLRIRPIEAPFNILGMPAYIGYYVTHNWDQGYMTFAPHTSSNKPALESGSVPKQALRIKYESENTPNGGLWSLAIAFFLTICGLAVFGYILWQNNEEYSLGTIEIAAWAAGGIVCAGIFFFIAYWLLNTLVFSPGNVIWPVTPEDEAITKINASHVTVLGFLSLFFYKLCGKKQVKAEVAADPEA